MFNASRSALKHFKISFKRNIEIVTFSPSLHLLKKKNRWKRFLQISTRFSCDFQCFKFYDFFQNSNLFNFFLNKKISHSSVYCWKRQVLIFKKRFYFSCIKSTKYSYSELNYKPIRIASAYFRSAYVVWCNGIKIDIDNAVLYTENCTLFMNLHICKWLRSVFLVTPSYASYRKRKFHKYLEFTCLSAFREMWLARAHNYEHNRRLCWVVYFACA